ncbi:hypothetical protein BCF44_116183 [Kutzneria buriramensis]|uniref:Leucine rich repeat (LRR) protein n=1 Tax=Kutzneria buriramensis TaxID=1045776 RepID=A0A3E0H219_9PSEU|nr:hypothetical protein BCF44_116183 [Kutzneria buriramensis]
MLHHIPQLAGLAENPALPARLLDRFVELADEELSYYLALRKDLTAEQKSLLAARKPVVELDPDVVPPERDPNTPPEVLTELGRRGDAVIDAGLAWNPATPPDVTARLVGHPVDFVRWQLVDRTDLPEWVYARLATDAMPGIRWDIAANPATPAAVLRRMVAADTSREMRRSLARNPSIPLDLLVDIAGTTRIGPTLLPRIANATVDELRGLATPRIMQVRMLVAEREDLADDLITLLVADRDPGVGKSIVTNPVLTAEQMWDLVTRHGPRLYPRAARNPNCPPDLMRHITRNAQTVRKAYRVIAKHPRAAADALLLCLQDKEARRHAARHPNLPPHTIVELVADPNPDVAEAAAANPSLPPAIMAELLGL